MGVRRPGLVVVFTAAALGCSGGGHYEFDAATGCCEYIMVCNGCKVSPAPVPCPPDLGFPATTCDLDSGRADDTDPADSSDTDL